MKEIFVSLDDFANKDRFMSVDNYKERINQVINYINSFDRSSILERVQVYLLSVGNIFDKFILLEKIIDRIHVYSKYDVDVHIMSNDDYLCSADHIITTSIYMINKYKKHKKTDVIMNVRVDSDIISSNNVIFLKMIKETGSKYLRLWVNFNESDLDNIKYVIDKLNKYSLLDNATITFDLPNFDKLESNIKEKLRSLDFKSLSLLLSSYINTAHGWAHNTIKCFNYAGETITKCPNYKECIHVSRQRSEKRMANLLVSLIESF